MEDLSDRSQANSPARYTDGFGAADPATVNADRASLEVKNLLKSSEVEVRKFSDTEENLTADIRD
jgi:hypothetical protein